ncbi:GNAT family N-acetyltransferase [Streptomyces sp. NPDC001404]|uniref:GNAT family N-acetyltransferase n=1 Tax=Streptomyces sp. NPDC001404 TaxID=3364571 RepID=UPI0036C2152C
MTVQLTMTEVVPGDPRMAADVQPLLHALRPALTPEACAAFVAEAHTQGLVFLAAYDVDGRCAGLATYRVLATSRGRVLFVDDLVTDPGRRSEGVGARLWEELESRAARAGCERVELDSGVTNGGAHRFYRARGMSVSAFHFASALR